MWEDVFCLCAGEMSRLAYKHTCAVIALTAHFSVRDLHLSIQLRPSLSSMGHTYSVLFERPSLHARRRCVCSFIEEKYTSPYEKPFCKALFTCVELISWDFPVC